MHTDFLSYRDRVVIVTGSGRGIGKVIAGQFAAFGAQVIIADRDAERSQETARQIVQNGGRAEYHPLDLTNLDQFEPYLAMIIAKYGKVSVLVNNARAGGRTGFLGETAENWEKVLDVSLRASLFLSQAFIKCISKEMLPASILNISSVSSTLVSTESAAYHAGKAALENLTRYLAAAGGPRGVRVNGVRLGFIVQDEHQERFYSDGNREYRQLAELTHPLGRVGSSRDVADAALFLCSERALFINGENIVVDGGFSTQDPFVLLMKHVKKST